MAEKIGYQSGIVAACNALRKEFPQYTAAWTKLERTLRILADDHDAAIGGGGGSQQPPPPPTYLKVAPRVAFKAGASDARFCLENQPGVTRVAANHWADDVATYDDNGLCKDGRRSDGPAPTSALELDGRSPCQLPTVGDPKKNTGSWAI